MDRQRVEESRLALPRQKMLVHNRTWDQPQARSVVNPAADDHHPRLARRPGRRPADDSAPFDQRFELAFGKCRVIGGGDLRLPAPADPYPRGMTDWFDEFRIVSLV